MKPSKIRTIISALFGLYVVSVGQTAASIEENGGVINNGALIGFLTGLLNNSAPVTGSWNYATLANAAGQTWNAANVPGGIAGNVLLRSGAAGVSDTTDTALNIVSAIPGSYVGMTSLFIVANTNSGTLTVVAGTNVTLAGTTTIVATGARFYQVKVTNLANYLAPGAAATNTTTTSSAVAPTTGSAVIPVTSATGIIVGSQLVIGVGTAAFIAGTVTNVASNNITIAPNVGVTIPALATVSVYNTTVTLTGMFSTATTTIAA